MVNTQKKQKNKVVIAKTTQKTAIKVGGTYTVKITALNAANLGLNEFTFGLPIFIGGLEKAKATLGDVVQVQVFKIVSKNTKYALSKITKVVTKGNSKTSSNLIGQTLDVTISKKALKGTFVALGPNNFKLIINSSNLIIGQKLQVKVTRIKENYGFATLANSSSERKLEKSKVNTSLKSSKAYAAGTKLSLVIPTNAKSYPASTDKKNFNMLVMQVNFASLGQQTSLNSKKAPTILFLKTIAGTKVGDKVQIQLLKGFKAKNPAFGGVLIGKVIEINPISAQNQKAIVQASIKRMLNSGMHFGEKAIKCNARMKNYVWTRKNVSKYSLKMFGSKYNAGVALETKSQKAKPEGINKPLIQKGRNIINLLKTRRCLNKALAQLTKYAAKGKTFLFVGTKKAASGLIARASLFSKKAFFVNTRWLGGMLTNWKTIFKSISKVRPILKEKQVIIKDILQKRQNIKALLMEKAFLLKKKSQLVLKKGRILFQKLAKNNSGASYSAASAQKLVSKRKEFVQKGQVLLEKRQLLLQKRKQLISQSQALYQKAVAIINNSIYPALTRATLLRQKLRELKALLFVSQQLQNLKQTAKAQNTNLYTVSYSTFTNISQTNPGYILPNPPKEILNKMVLFINQIKNAKTASNITQKEAASGEGRVLVLTKLLSQLNSFAPAIKASIKVLLANLQKVQAKLTSFQETLKTIIAKMQSFMTIKANILVQLRQIQNSLVSQRNIIRVVKKKFKQILAQKRFIQFLPKLRYLPTPSTKISQTVQVLMNKIVDPKLKYPMDSIYDQKLSSQSKKVAAMRKKKWQRLEKYLGGISNMTQIMAGGYKQIQNNVAIIIGQHEEMNAVRECQKLGIKMFHIVDTNCNPGLADHFIPANDDSRNSIQFILTQFLTRIRLAQKLKKTVAKVKKGQKTVAKVQKSKRTKTTKKA